MTWQRRSRTVRPPPFPLAGCGGNFLASGDAGARSAEDAISSTVEKPIPQALRRARLTARGSATRISAPRTREETLEGSASPYPTKALQGDVRTTALNTQRLAEISVICCSRLVSIPKHFLLCSNRTGR